MTLGEKIASARKEKGMTQEMLAEQLGGNTAGCGKVGNRIVGARCRDACPHRRGAGHDGE